MRKKILIACVAAFALMTTSCGVSMDSVKNQNLQQTQVQLTKKNFKVVGYAEGTSTQVYWLGIGGMSHASMYQSAIADMYKNANLKGSQTIINQNVTCKMKSFLLYNRMHVMSTGTIIEFTD